MNKIYLIIGPSGSGKTHIAGLLEQKYRLKSIESYTTRPPRYDGEKGHTFITLEDYEAFDKSQIAAYNCYNGNHYFATFKQIEEADLYVIDIAGLKYFQEKYEGKKEFVTVHLTANLSTRINRMMQRGDSLSKIAERIIVDREEFNQAEADCDYVIDTSNMTPDEVAKRFMKWYYWEEGDGDEV